MTAFKPDTAAAPQEPRDLIDRIVFAILNTLDLSEAWAAARRDPEALRAAVRRVLPPDPSESIADKPIGLDKGLGDYPKCRDRGTCMCLDGCGACDGCGRWLEDEMKPIRARVRVAVIDLLHALDDRDLGALPSDAFDREIDAIIHAAKGLL